LRPTLSVPEDNPPGAAREVRVLGHPGRRYGPPALTAAATPLRLPRLSWRAQLALVGLVALALRVAYALLDAEDPGITGDADWYHEMANLLADGRGYDNPFEPSGAVLVPTGGDAPPTAFHPPLFPVLLAIPSLVGLDSYVAHELTACLMAAGTAVVAALAGRELAGPRAGLLAGLLVAVSPTLIGADAVLMSESLYGLLIATALLAAAVAVREPSRVNLAALGLVIALAALTRGEGVFLLLVLALPVALAAGGSPREKLGRWALVVLACALTIAPWTARNWVVFDRPVLVTTTDGSVLAGANTEVTYFGDSIGFWTPAGLETGEPAPENEAVLAAELREQAVEYAKDHPDRLPAVAAARVLRTYGVWHPDQLVTVAAFFHGQQRWFAWIAFGWALLMLVAGAAAYVVARRSVGRLWILLTPALLVAITSVIGFGDARFRVALDVSLCVLVAVGAERVLARRRSATG
jgi:4-amino-4-deoxy-L-arabinose transferase-like glycosyltransferase